jgi:GTP cyclohydrolase FolE2
VKAVNQESIHNHSAFASLAWTRQRADLPSSTFANGL